MLHVLIWSSKQSVMEITTRMHPIITRKLNFHHRLPTLRNNFWTKECSFFCNGSPQPARGYRILCHMSHSFIPSFLHICRFQKQNPPLIQLKFLRQYLNFWTNKMLNSRYKHRNTHSTLADTALHVLTKTKQMLLWRLPQEWMHSTFTRKLNFHHIGFLNPTRVLINVFTFIQTSFADLWIEKEDQFAARPAPNPSKGNINFWKQTVRFEIQCSIETHLPRSCCGSASEFANSWGE